MEEGNSLAVGFGPCSVPSWRTKISQVMCQGQGNKKMDQKVLWLSDKVPAWIVMEILEMIMENWVCIIYTVCVCLSYFQMYHWVWFFLSVGFFLHDLAFLNIIRIFKVIPLFLRFIILTVSVAAGSGSQLCVYSFITLLSSFHMKEIS